MLCLTSRCTSLPAHPVLHMDTSIPPETSAVRWMALQNSAVHRYSPLCPLWQAAPRSPSTSETDPLLQRARALRAQTPSGGLPLDPKAGTGTGGWSAPLLTGRRSSSSGWDLSSTPGSSLPPAGQRKSIEVGHKQSFLNVVLAAELVAQVHPCLLLLLMDYICP